VLRVWPKNRFVAGTYKRECDVCGFDYLRSDLRKRYDGALVCSADFEEEDTQLKKTYRQRNSFIKD